MSKHKEEKTNVMRTLEQKKIAYTPHEYPADGPVDGVSVAAYLNQDPEQVFKTLVTKGAGGGYYVFDIPVAENLDLKKAAKAVGEKSIAMLPQKELLPLTGYVHGGCSPVGMKKQFPTVFHETVELFDTICVSPARSVRRWRWPRRTSLPCWGRRRRTSLWNEYKSLKKCHFCRFKRIVDIKKWFVYAMTGNRF